MFEDIPTRAQGIYTTSENVLRSLTCNYLVLSTAKIVSATPLILDHPTPLSPEDLPALASEESLGAPELTPKCAYWLLSRMILICLYSYFSWVSAASSLWTPLQEAMSALYCMTSWWILPPGWEPNLVSLAPLSHMFNPKTSTISAFLTIYETAMRQESDEIKKEHILPVYT
ncbi:hypothetical protein DSO57_1020012 [Entomophthora muscae]|uniref:Uncharacterized protein n=1 Tax=Entomophthora muscae TaxID=34485 RepID=A0ACC2UCS7_9FUNG|nr:hypothetical protein DSO57_1020012 [Entomophthora muscae]